jgi:serine protease Do
MASALAPSAWSQQRDPAREPSGLEAALALEEQVVAAIAKAERSVVAIARVRKESARLEPERQADEGRLPLQIPEITDPTSPDYVPSEFGSGVVIDAKGLIVTNYHVLGDTKSADYYVWLAKKPYPARIKGADPWLDLAVLEIDVEGPLSNAIAAMPLGNARDLKKGQFVIALGNPYAIARDGQPSATWGLVSNLSRKAPMPQTDTRPSERGETLHHWGTLIQTDARLELGASGGALVNLKGEMVGLTTSLAALAGYEKSGGFAYPVDDTFRHAVDQLKIGKLPEYGFLGVSPQPLAAEERRAGRAGALVRDVVPATPAAQAGLRAGDVITRIDGLPIADSVELIRELSGKPAGTIVTISYERGGTAGRRGHQAEVKLPLSKKRMEGARPAIAEVTDPPWRGMKVEYATASPLFIERCRDLDDAGCVGVIEVERDSPAWKAGFRPGDFVSHVGQTRVATPQEFYEAVGDATGDVKLQLTAVEAANEYRTVAAPSP